MSQRILKVNQLIKKELSQIILKEIDFPQDVLVTITRVETALNLMEANVWISVMFTTHQKFGEGPKEKIKGALEILNKNIYILQQKLNQRLKMRPLPRIKFLEEKKTAEAGQVEEILERLKK